MDEKAATIAEGSGQRVTLPEAFATYTRHMMGEGLYAAFEKALQEEPPVSVRINTRKWDMAEGEPVPWSDDCYYLPERPAFTFDPLLHAGGYYVQEASSMFIAHALKEHLPAGDAPLLAIDMCASPGGKSIAVLQTLEQWHEQKQNQSDGQHESVSDYTLISNEPIRQRAQILAENIHKWGDAHTIVTNNYPQDFLGTGLQADIMVCDVPCSGEGMFRKDSGAVAEWSVQNVEKCRTLQRDIVEQAWQLMKSGALMIYSTCTFNTRENEENVQWICEHLGGTVLPVSTRPEWHITGSLLEGFSSPVYRFIPGRTRGEGLFMAVIRKDEGDSPTLAHGSNGKGKTKQNRKDNKKKNKKGYSLSPLPSPLSSINEFLTHGDTISAMPPHTAAVHQAVSGKLRTLKAGITVAVMKGKDAIPQQSLALATDLRQDAFPSVSVDRATAIAYLRKEAIALPEGTPRGFVIVSYQGHPLGFMKNIGNRANNLYPQEWKIKSTHTPYF